MADDLQERMQALVDGLCSLDADSGVTVITSVLQARPEMATPVVAFAVPDLTFPPSRALIERRAEGVIKSFSQEKGFGFIDCQELKEAFGNDVFFHHSQLGPFTAGSMVSFAVMLNKDTKPQAYDMQTPENAKGMMKGAAGKGMMKGGCFGAAFNGWGGAKGGCDGGWGAGAGAGKGPYGGKGGGGGCGMLVPMGGKGLAPGKGVAPAKGTAGGFKGKVAGTGKAGKTGKGKEKGEEIPLGQYVGVVKSFNEKNAYGFVECAEISQEYGGDVFLHASDKGNFVVGDTVMFTGLVNTMGKPQARNLQYADESGGAAKRPRTAVVKGGW